MKTLKARIAADKITAEAVMTDRPSWAEESGWDAGANWYSVTLRMARRQLTVPFGMGSAHTEEPSAADVLDCLASDASGFENARGFEDWAGEYGYDTDSRKAERTYRQIEAQTEKLRKFLGDKYQAYLYETERM